MDAPLLMVVGGSTGAGKSTLVNSLVGAEVSTAGVLRPTTRAPVLACHPADVPWFEDDRILPGLSRTTGGAAGPARPAARATDALPPGLALLDAPDIDSVVEANRALAAPAARRRRRLALRHHRRPLRRRRAVGPPRTPRATAAPRSPSCSTACREEAAADVRDAPARAMLAEHGLRDTPLLVVPETRARGGPPARRRRWRPCATWLDGLAADAQARAELVRRTLAGALESLPRRTAPVEAALAEQLEAAAALARGGRRRLRRRGRRGRRRRQERRAAARRGARPLARRRRHGRPDALAGDARRLAARPRAQPRHGRARAPDVRAQDGRAERRRRGRAAPPPTAPPSAPPPPGAATRQGARCSPRARRLDAASATLAGRRPPRRCAPGRATCSTSCARRGRASAPPRGSPRSASTAPGSP